MNRSSCPLALLLILLTLACFMLAPQTRAICQEGCHTAANTVLGDNALFNVTTGYWNTAVGFLALHFDTTGFANTASGPFALYNNTTGYSNTAIGFNTLVSNTTGYLNTANGAGSLYYNTTGADNTAIGAGALSDNTTGNNNTANGFNALLSNTTGVDNTATGFQALMGNKTANANVADGFKALQSNTSGANNSACGANALISNTTGNDNTALGQGTLPANTTGENNTATGNGALQFNTIGNGNTADGLQALNDNTTGSNNIGIGNLAGFNLTTGSDNIDIGNKGVSGEAGTIRIGTAGSQINAYLAGISGVTVPTGVAVIVDSSGHLGTTTSSARFKEAIKPMDKTSESIFALQPVTFRYKHDLDPQSIPQFGLVAEEVEKVNPDLVACDSEGKPYTVRYEAVNAMLLNEFLKEHKKVEEQQGTIAQLKSTVAQQQEGFEAKLAQQQKQIDALTTGLQKASAQLDLSKSAPQTVSNHR